MQQLDGYQSRSAYVCWCNTACGRYRSGAKRRGVISHWTKGVVQVPAGYLRLGEEHVTSEAIEVTVPLQVRRVTLCT
jgi:hypothetical protein